MPVFSRLIAYAVTVGMLLASAGAALAGVGQPSPWELGLQDAASPVMADIIWFHDFLLWIITAIAVFVLILLVIVMVRFNARANPTPSRTTHNPVLEVAWTIVPVDHPGGDRRPFVPALVPAARRAEAGPHGEGDRQAMVLELQLSR